MRLLALIAALSAFINMGACATAASNEEMKATIFCLGRAAGKLDDHISDAVAVAYGVTAACGPEIRQTIAVTARGMTFAQYQRVRTRLSEYFLKVATELVLTERSSRASKSNAGQTRPADLSVRTREHALDDATLAYQRGDYATAFRIIRPLAERGDKLAEQILGVMYDEGKGVAQNYAEALKWWRKLAERGDANAEFMVGLRYADGKAGVQDNTEAVKWLKLAAQQGEPNAQKVLDSLYASFPKLHTPMDNGAAK